jgi:hypothetical protein
MLAAIGRRKGGAHEVCALCSSAVDGSGRVLPLGRARGSDSTYHTGHIELAPLASAPLSSGFVQNIHANGPNVYAHEIYQLNGAEPSSSFQVVLSIWTANTSCSGEPALQLPTAVVTTNGAGNGLADVVFTPADADGLRGLTVSAM